LVIVTAVAVTAGGVFELESKDTWYIMIIRFHRHQRRMTLQKQVGEGGTKVSAIQSRVLGSTYVVSVLTGRAKEFEACCER
jgi:hypothetical protein